MKNYEGWWLWAVSSDLVFHWSLKADRSWRATLAVQPLHVIVRHCVGCVAGLHAIVTRQSCFVSVRLNEHMEPQPGKMPVLSFTEVMKYIAFYSCMEQ